MEGGSIGMGQGVTRGELRKIRSIALLIGEENLPSLPRTEYLSVRGLHVYAARNEDNDLTLSIWNEPKENKTSRCLFADCISVRAFRAALEYWKPRHQSTSGFL